MLPMKVRNDDFFIFIIFKNKKQNTFKFDKF